MDVLTLIIIGLNFLIKCENVRMYYLIVIFMLFLGFEYSTVFTG